MVRQDLKSGMKNEARSLQTDENDGVFHAATQHPRHRLMPPLELEEDFFGAIIVDTMPDKA